MRNQQTEKLREIHARLDELEGAIERLKHQLVNSAMAATQAKIAMDLAKEAMATLNLVDEPTFAFPHHD